MSEEKEKLTSEEEKDTSIDNQQEEENNEDYFNPFADTSDEDKAEDKKVEKEIEEDEKKEEVEPVKVDSNLEGKVAEIEASTMAARDVTKLVNSKPEFAGMSDELIDLYAKAKVKGHSKPLEFAVRNVKSPDYWMELGKQQNSEATNQANQTRIGGGTAPKASSNQPDYTNMPTDDFMQTVRKIEQGA